MSTTGVIVARFQTTELHSGHRALLDEVTQKHRNVLVVLGTARTYVPTFWNPLDFERRQEMVTRAYPNVRCVPHRDCRSNTRWSALLDELVDKAFPGQDGAVLYGSRASFIPSYTGKCPVVELPEVSPVSATELRQDAVDKPALSREFRAGAVYVASTRPPLVYQTVDIAVISESRANVLLGSKLEDEGALRFIGGFVDVQDESLEAAAKREAFEETGGVELAEFRYIGSAQIDDWRYRKTKDRIMTSFFVARHVFGLPKASDDLDGSAKWYDIFTIQDRLVEEHRVLGKLLREHGEGARWWQ